jgi:hypothetical protein
MYSNNIEGKWTKLLDKKITATIFSILSKNILYFFSYDKGNLEINKFSSTPNLHNQKINLNLPYYFKLDAVTITNDSLYFVGREENNLSLYKYEIGANKITKLSEISNSSVAESINDYDNIFSIVLTKPYGFGSSTSILYNEDYGKNWKHAEIPLEHYFTPHTFHENKYYGYSGLGRIQIIDLKISKSF